MSICLALSVILLEFTILMATIFRVSYSRSPTQDSFERISNEIIFVNISLLYLYKYGPSCVDRAAQTLDCIRWRWWNKRMSWYKTWAKGDNFPPNGFYLLIYVIGRPCSLDILLTINQTLFNVRPHVRT